MKKLKSRLAGNEQIGNDVSTKSTAGTGEDREESTDSSPSENGATIGPLASADGDGTQAPSKPPATPAVDDVAPDPFDPASLRLGQDFGASLGVKKVVTVVPCRKPHNQEFVRVRPGEDYRIETAVFEDKINRESFLVDRGLWSELAGIICQVCLFTAVSRQANVFLWQVKLPGADGRSNAWNDSALSAARLAETRWVRVSSNMPAGMYDVFEAASGLSEPEWPDLTFTELLRISFRDRFIRDINHPLLRALRGEQ